MIQLAQAWRLPDDAPIIMLPGRLTRWKGQSVLIEASRRLARSDVRVLLVGDDQGRTAYREELDDQIKRIGAEGIIHLTGQCRDMPAAYMLSDVVVSASTDPEAFGRVAAEAQAMGRPVRAALAMKPEDRDAVAHRAIAHIRKNFTKARMCEETLAVYNELLRGAGRA